MPRRQCERLINEFFDAHENHGERWTCAENISIEEVRAFVPAPLPPVPALELIGGVRNSLDQGLLALGRLDGAAGTLPYAHLLLYTYVRKEAVLSSQIEGRQSTLNDLLAHELGEAPGIPIGDVAEVTKPKEDSNYWV